MPALSCLLTKNANASRTEAATEGDAHSDTTIAMPCFYFGSLTPRYGCPGFGYMPGFILAALPYIVILQRQAISSSRATRRSDVTTIKIFGSDFPVKPLNSQRPTSPHITISFFGSLYLPLIAERYRLI